MKVLTAQFRPHSSRLALLDLMLPEHDGEELMGDILAASKGPPANPLYGQSQLPDQRRGHGQESGEAGVYHGLYVLPLSQRALHCQGNYGFVGVVHFTLNHSALRQGRPPK